MRLVHTVIFAVLLLSTVRTARAEDSLLDPAKTRQLPPEEQKNFGKRSVGRAFDERMIRAAEIAQRRAHPRMTWHCWKYVKDALLAADVVPDRPTSAWARQAGAELCAKYGFTKLNIRDPYKAPIGAVVVYGGSDAGHVELRTSNGFVSDFISRRAYPRPLVGVYVKKS